jgi:hypothetical protein
MPPMRNALTPFRLTVLLAALVLALVLSACGGGDDSTTEVADLGPDPATMTPADAPIYGDVVIKPSGTMSEDLDSALSKLLGTDDPGGMLRDAIDSELSSDPSNGGLTYTNDVEPWIGARAGGFLSDYDVATKTGDGALVIAVTDPDAANAFIDKATALGTSSKPTDESYQGVDYKYDATDDSAVGVDGDFLVAGTKQGFEDAVDAGAGDSLADNPDATSARDDAPDNSLFSGYVDTAAAVDLIKSSGALSGAQLKQFENQISQYATGPVEFWGAAGPSTFAFGASSPAQSGAAAPSDLAASFPADSWLAFASAGVGEQIQSSIDQFKSSFQAALQAQGVSGLNADPLAQIKKATGLDLSVDFNWIGDAGGFVQGSSVLGLGAGLVLESTDDDAATAAIGKLQSALGHSNSLQISPTDTGFSVQIAGAPVGAEVGLQDGKVVLAVGADTIDDVVSPSETLDGSDRFNAATDALGDGVTPSFFLDFAPVISLIESTGQATQDPDYQSAKPYLDALDYLVSGSKVDGDRSTASIVLGVKDAGDDSTTASTAALTAP